MKKFLFFALVSLIAFASCKKADPAPEATLTQVTEVVPWDGGEIELQIKANCNWEFTADSGVDLSFSPAKGTGDGTIKVTLPSNKTNDQLQLTFSLTISSNDGQYNKSPLAITIPKPSLDYGGRTYSVVYLEDGNYWMSDPLSYVPDGVTVSDAPATGIIMYPYTVKEGAVSVLKDDASIKSNGFLYKASAFLGKTIDASNCTSLEGVQGICPDGWHIPTWNEWFNLVGASNALADGSKVTDNDKAIFWDADLKYASVVKANEKGFNFVFSGTVANTAYQKTVTSATTTDVEAFVGKPAMTYFACSTGILSSKGEPQMFAPMSTFTKTYLKGRLSLAYANTDKVASQVRCIKDNK